MRILNLEAGMGGNRELWFGCEVTAVEQDYTIAEVYKKLFPNDVVIVGDANSYLEQYYESFDFIWSSPPCTTHGQYRHNVGVLAKGYKKVIPDMTSLYGKVVFLSTYYQGKWVVENTTPYYDFLIEPTIQIERHWFWSNFIICPPTITFEVTGIRRKNKISDFEHSEIIAKSTIKNKRQVLRNRVNPQLGLHVYKEMLESLGVVDKGD